MPWEGVGEVLWVEEDGSRTLVLCDPLTLD